MQNVTLPDRDEIRIALGNRSDERVERAVVSLPMLSLKGLALDVVQLQAFVRALYAKHGEVCPLFGEDEK